MVIRSECLGVDPTDRVLTVNHEFKSESGSLRNLSTRHVLRQWKSIGVVLSECGFA